VFHSLSSQSVLGGVSVNGDAVNVTGYRWAILVANIGTYGPADNGSIRFQVSADGTTGWSTLIGSAVTVTPTDDNITIYGQVDIHKIAEGAFLRVRFINGSAVASLVSGSIVLLGGEDTQGPVPTVAQFNL
jgi:hypothetical protein